MKLGRNRAERRNKKRIQVLYKGIPYLIFLALAAGYLAGTPSAHATGAIACVDCATVMRVYQKGLSEDEASIVQTNCKIVSKSSRIFAPIGAGLIGRTNASNSAQTGLPTFTYTGTYTLLDDGNGDWRLKFLTSGTYTPESTITIDACCVGGGGGGITTVSGYTHGCGGGGYVSNYSGIVLNGGTGYPVTIGAGGALDSDGGITWIVQLSLYYANGGHHGLRALNTAGGTTGGAGGSGGAAAVSLTGGTDGADGESIYASGHWFYGGAGQGTTTREFAEATGALYSTGGGSQGSLGANTGDGAIPTGSGYSGILVIRNHRAA